MWAQKVQPGFTIVELLIVIVVIAILATVTIIGYNGVSQQARASAVQSDLAQAVRKIELAKVESGIDMYPASLPSGVNSNAGSNYVYSYDQNLNRFCLTTYQGDTAYYASTSDATPHEGRCQDNNRLVGWWKLNGNTDDSSELGNNATVHGGAVPTISQNGISNHAYAFNGSSDFLSTTVSSEVNDLFATSGQSWTATAWFKNTRPNGSSSVIIGRGGGTGSSATFGLSVNSSNNLFAALRGNSTTIGPVDDTTWYFGAVSWDGQTARGYLNDAAPVNLGVGTASLQDYNFKIGATANGNNHFPGSIDDVRLFSRALSVSELADMYQRGAE